MAYDWLYDKLAPTERETVVKAIAERGRILFRRHTGRNCILSYPYDSHGQTSIGYMALVALAVAGDVPEADEWLEYTIKGYANSFPPWGGADGGWSQGVTYWEGSSYTASACADALRSATGIDLYQKPWYRQNGYFKMYCHPPWCTMSHFGDAHPEGPGALGRNSLARCAAIYGDPYLQWCADRIPGRMDTSPYGYFLYSSHVTPKPPFDLTQARLFRDVGWAAMHSRLYAPDDVMLMAKSSWYGSCSHSHADQNSFVIYAYGEPLAIDSGYYPWWMSPHHKAWSLQTKAHNCILVDGEGQPIQDITAKGQCVGWLAGPGSAFWEGEAAPAYAGKLKRFRRHIAFLPPDLFIVYDDVQSPRPATFQWTLHAVERMTTDPANRSALIRRGDARLLVKHIWPKQLSQSQHDDFGVPPEPRRGRIDKQWHYTAETVAKSDRAEFLTVMRAFQGDSTPDLTVSAHASGNRRSLVVRTDDREVRFMLGPLCSPGSSPLQLDRSASMVETADGKVTRFMLANSVGLPASAPDLVSATRPVSLVAKKTPDGMRLFVASQSETMLRLRLDRAPNSVTLAGRALNNSEWSYQDGRLSFRVADGDHEIEICHRQPITVASDTKLSVSVGGKVLEVAGGAGRSVNDTRVAWASFGAKPGAYRVSLRGTDSAEVWLDRQRLKEGCETTLQAKNMVLVESALDGPFPSIAFEIP